MSNLNGATQTMHMRYGFDAATTRSVIVCFHNGVYQVLRDHGSESVISAVHVRLEPVSAEEAKTMSSRSLREYDGKSYRLDIAAGFTALQRAKTEPTGLIKFWKNLTGFSYSGFKQTFPTYPELEVVKGNNDELLIQTYAYVTNAHGDRVLIPVKLSILEIWSYFIYQALNVVTSNVRDGLSMSQVKIDLVLTCPAYFGNDARTVLKDAATIMGFNVLRIISEPTAAALAYGVKELLSGGDAKQVLVFDLGGGTFDVSVIEITKEGEEETFDVVTTYGDPKLGGRDFDQILVNYTSKYISENPGKLGLKDGITVNDVLSDRIFLAQLRAECENCRISLSTNDSNNMMIPFSGMIKGVLVSFNLIITIKKVEFEALSAPLLAKIKTTMKESIQKAKDKGVTKIKDICFVGGMCNTPMIREVARQVMSEISGGEKVREIIDNQLLDIAVAKGASIMCELLTDKTKSSNITLIDVVALSVGIETAGGVFTVMVPENSTIPTKKSQIFTTYEDNQTAVTIRIAEGSRPLFKDNKYLGTFTLHGIPPMRRGTPQIEVTISVDVNGILVVSAKEGNNTMQITISDRTSSADIEKLKKEATEYKEKDEQAKALIDARNNLDSTKYSAKSNAETFKDKISSDLFNDIMAVVKEGDDLIERTRNSDYSIDLIEEYNACDKKISDMMSKIGEEIQKNSTPNSSSEPSSNPEPESSSQ